jgi:hypothetical protein
MTQQLWYVRRHGEVSGPFPIPQIQQAHDIGLMSAADEVSMDGQYWLGLAEAGILTSGAAAAKDSDEAWRAEREKARLRWLNDAVETVETVETAAIGAEQIEIMERLRRHEADTRSLMTARSSRRPAVLAGLLALLAVVAIGVGVWVGQSGDPGISASLVRKAGQCRQPATEGVSWATCNMSDAALRGSNLRNADLSHANFERADLSAADLSYANLAGANLRGTSLRGARLKGAALARGDLTGADLRDADLSFAELSAAILDGARLDGARLSRATMPDGRVCAEPSLGACR